MALPPISNDRTLGRRQPEYVQDGVQEVPDDAEQASSIQKTGDGTQQVAQEIAGSRFGGDVQHHPVELNPQPEEILVQGSEDEPQDVATRKRSGSGGGGVAVVANLRGGDYPPILDDASLGAVAPEDGPVQQADRPQLAVTSRSA